MYIPLEVTPHIVDASVSVRGLQESLELGHELSARLDVLLGSSDRVTINRLRELLLELLILVAHPLPRRSRLWLPETTPVVATWAAV